MDIETIISNMTLEEKADYVGGASFWTTHAIKRLGLPEFWVSDGPHGLRRQDGAGDHLGINDSIKAVCFPSESLAACSFDKDLLKEEGEALGEECQAADVAVLLGPGATLKRSPLCGRNFEYYSEDPYLSGMLAAAWIQGVESKNVGTSLKHFFANNQETRRMTVSAEMDERTMHEIYLASFENAVKTGKPSTVMCSYNRINGVYAAENAYALTQCLRQRWGFDGFVVSDWGAVNDRVPDLKAGLDLEMPAPGPLSRRSILDAIADGSLPEAVLDEAVRRILRVLKRYDDNRVSVPFDYAGHHEMVRRIARESMVLLKNEGAMLPLAKGGAYAFIGAFAKTPRYQGGGSSHINTWKVTSALEACQEMADITFAQGYLPESASPDETLIAEAVEAAKAAEKAVLFVGLSDSFESEGYDRTHMRMPDGQTALIEAVVKAQPNTVVLLHNGAPVEMPWIADVPAVLECYLGGEAVGAAQADLLFGDYAPCGKLAETFPKRVQDNPSWLTFPGEQDRAPYSEGIYMGYRYYDKKDMDVLFPFGHGLSYTTFEYSDLKIPGRIRADESLTVTLTVKNTGAVPAKEAVQLYIAPKSACRVSRPVQELKGFAKAGLKPGEQKEVSISLPAGSFAYWETNLHDWYTPSGVYEIRIGASSRDIRLRKEISVEAVRKLKLHYTINTPFGDLKDYPKVMALAGSMDRFFQGEDIEGIEEATGKDSESQAVGDQMALAIMESQPLRSVATFAKSITVADIQKLVDEINAEQ